MAKTEYVVRKVGHSLTMTIPFKAAKLAGFHEGTHYQVIEAQGKKITVKRID